MRHGLAAPSDSVERVVDDLVVLHASDPATVYLSVRARLADASVEQIEAALFDRRTVMRTLAMRRTLFVATVDGLPAVEGSSSVAVAAAERKRLEKFLSESAMTDPRRWLSTVADRVMDALDAEAGGLSARDLTRAVPELATRVTMAAGTRHSVEVGATSRVLGLMAVEGRLVRGRPAGDWTGRTYRWHRRDRWWPNGRAIEPEPEPEASIDLLGRWLCRFGPATIQDMRWWTGWTMTKTRATLDAIDTTEVSLDGQLSGETGHLRADDAEPVADPGPWAALLPALDPTAMGWKHRHWYLGRHQQPLFDRNGNIGPTVWADGRIVGGWSQRADGEVVVELLEPVGSDHRVLIEAEVERLADFVGPVIVKPSFPTPLQKRLSSG